MAKKPLYSQRHYEDIGRVLCRNNASGALINSFSWNFQHDNPSFDAVRFVDFVQKCKRERRG